MLPMPFSLSSILTIGLYTQMASLWPKPIPSLSRHNGTHTFLRPLSPSLSCIEPIIGLQAFLSTHWLHTLAP